MTDLRLEVQPEQLEIAERATLGVELRNVSDVVEHYEALLLGLPDGVSETIDPPVAKLRPGERASLSITLVVDGTPHAGEYVLGVLVRSSAGDLSVGGASRCDEVRLRVPRRDDVVVMVDPPHLEGGALAAFQTTLRNRGNAPVRMQLTGQDSAGKASLAFRPSWVDVPAEGQAVAEASVRCAPPWTGSPQRRDLTITARGAAGPATGATDSGFTGVGPEAVTGSASFTQRARLAPAAMRSARGLVTMGVGVATVLGAALLARDPVVEQLAAQDPTPSGEPTGNSSSAAETPSEEALPPSPTPGDEGSEAPADELAGPTTTDNPTPGANAPPADAVTLYQPPEGVDLPPSPAPLGADISLETDTFASQGVALLAGLPDADLVDPRCADATGLSGRDLGNAAAGYVQPAIPGRPEDCNDVPLQVDFEPQPTSVELYLPTVASESLYAVRVTYNDNVVEEVSQAEVHAPGEPDFVIELKGSAAIRSLVLSRVQDGSTTPAPVALSWMRVTLNRS